MLKRKDILINTYLYNLLSIAIYFLSSNLSMIVSFALIDNSEYNFLFDTSSFTASTMSSEFLMFINIPFTLSVTTFGIEPTGDAQIDKAKLRQAIEKKVEKFEIKQKENRKERDKKVSKW